MQYNSSRSTIMPLTKQYPSPHITTPWGKGESDTGNHGQRETPRLPSRRFGGGRRLLVRKRLGEDDERWKKNKKAIDNYVRRMAKLAGKDLSLNPDGVTFFAFKKFIVVVEVPADNAGVCFIYTMVCRLGPSDDRAEALKVSMELNYMQNGTRGSTLGLDGEEVNMCYSCQIAGLCFADLKTALEDFLLTAVEVNEQLDAAKRGGQDSLRSCGSI
jgi:hypothetical protein